MSNVLIPYSGLREKGVTLGKCQIWRLEKQGRFPKRVQVSENRIAWVEREIDAWIEAKIAERDALVERGK